MPPRLRRVELEDAVGEPVDDRRLVSEAWAELTMPKTRSQGDAVEVAELRFSDSRIESAVSRAASCPCSADTSASTFPDGGASEPSGACRP
jgi:hypothetical protein